MSHTDGRRCGWIAPICCMLLLGLPCCPTHAQKLESTTFKPPEEAPRRRVCIRQAPSPAVIDGALNEDWWAQSVISDRFTSGRRPPHAKTVLMGAFDAQHLYLAAISYTDAIDRLKRRRPAGERDGGVWSDDCIDFKLSPDGGRTEYQILVNPNGARDEMRNSKKGWNPDWRCAASIGADSYVVEMAIPLAAIGLPPKTPGASALFTFGRCDRARQPSQISSAFEPYGKLDEAPFLILGTEEQYEQRLASAAVTRDVGVALYLDRDQYPSFQSLATGRVRISSARAGQPLAGQPGVRLRVRREAKDLFDKTIQPVTGDAMDFDLSIDGMAPGEYELLVDVMDGDAALAGASRSFVVVKRDVKRSGRIAITVPPTAADMPSWPITFGVPLPWGALDSPEHVKLLDGQGREVPVQVKAAGRWSKKGSIRWLLLDFLPPVGRSDRAFTLLYGPDVRRAAPDLPPMVQETDKAVTVTTGPLKFLVPKRKTPGIAQVWLHGEKQLATADDMTGPYLLDEGGTRFSGIRDPEAQVVVEESGPLKACVRVSGWHTAEDGKRLGMFILRYYAYRGLPYVRVFHTFVITEHSDKARYRDIAYALPFASQYCFFGTPGIDAAKIRGKGAYLLQQDDQHFKLYEDGAFLDEGVQAEGWLSTGRPGRMMTLAVKDFWQQFPKEMEVTPDRTAVHFWPAHGEEPIRTGKDLAIRNVYHQWFAHEGALLNFKVPEEALVHVKRDSERYNYPSAKIANAIGLAKTHEMLLYFHTDDWEKARARSTSLTFQDAPAAVCSPEWVCATKVFGAMHPKDAKRFPRVEKALDEVIACIARHRETDRDYGMFNFGDSHHNWFWQERRWNLHRIWRNTHHGWTRWPWLIFARTGAKRLLDWADRNARHIADVDHCHFATKDFIGLPWPRGKCVGGICDYKGFVHWASGARLHYNSAADAMIWHYYMTGNERSRTAALEHGTAMAEGGRGKPCNHREGSGRTTSACALYFLTWNNDYLEFLERTVDRLLSTQAGDGSFPQWENFAPFLQRYVDLTQSRRGMEAMVKWADWIADQETATKGYHSKINILSHAYLYAGKLKHLQSAAYKVGMFVDHVYEGEDPRYRGMFIAFPSNLDQSYFMQEAPYYLTAVLKHGREPKPLAPTRTSIRALSRETIDGKQKYVFRARIRQEKEGAFQLALELRGYDNVGYAARLRPLGDGKEIRGETKPEPHLREATLSLAVPKDGALEYELMILADKNFFVRVPITYGQSELKEVYPIFRDGTWIGGGFPYYFTIPEAADSLSLCYTGRAWPLEFSIFDPDGRRTVQDIWIGSNSPSLEPRLLTATVGKNKRDGWSFRVVGYGMACLRQADPSPKQDGFVFYFAAARDKLFSPAVRAQQPPP